MVELGSGRLVPGFEEQLQGAAAGEERTVTVDLPRRLPAPPSWPARRREFAVSVKEVKAKELPELDDDLAAEAGFDTLDELREDIRSRLAETETTQIEAEFREAALDSAVKAATVEIPDALAEARARELWDQMLHSLAHQGIDARGLPADRRPRGGRDRRAEQARRRAGAAARGGARRDHRGRGHRADRGGGARAVEQAAGDGPGSPRRRSCWSA